MDYWVTRSADDGMCQSQPAKSWPLDVSILLLRLYTQKFRTRQIEIFVLKARRNAKKYTLLDYRVIPPIYVE